MTKPLESLMAIKQDKSDGGDLRIDKDSDGKVDAVRIQEGSTTTDVYFKDGGNSFRIEDKQGQDTTTINGTFVGSTPQISSGYVTRSNDSGSGSLPKFNKDGICGKINENLKTFNSSNLQKFSLNQMNVAFENMLEDSCFEEPFRAPDYVNSLVRFYDQTDPLSGISCLEKLQKKTQAAYDSGQASEEDLLRVELALSEGRSEMATILEGKSSNKIVKCEKGPKSECVLQSGRTLKVVESGESFPVNFNKTLYQRLGVPGDIDVVVKSCDASVAFKDKLSTAHFFAAPLSIDNSSALSQTVVKKFAPTQIAAVNKNLAETKINLPSATEASPQNLARIEATQGTAAVQQVMAKQSSGISTMTNAVMSAVNTPAVAQTRTMASVTTKSVSYASPDSVSSGLSSSRSRSTSTAAQKSSPALKKTVLKDGDRIVEEIDLDKKNNSTRSAQSAARLPEQASLAMPSSSAVKANRAPASAGGAKGNATATVGGDSSDQASSSASGSRGGSLGARSSGSDGGGNNNKNQARRQSSSSGGGESVSTDELVSFINNSDYKTAKRKVQDTGFQEKLKNNGITITDQAGNSVGAPKGTVIFMDKGNRFEKQ